MLVMEFVRCACAPALKYMLYILYFSVTCLTVENRVCSKDIGTIDIAPTHISQTTVHLMLNASFTCQSRIYAWSYIRTHTRAKIFASVWRQEETPVGYFRLVGRNVLPPTVVGHHTVEIPEKDRIKVEAGDFIGYHYSNEVYQKSEPGAIAVAYGNNTASLKYFHTLTVGYYDENFNVDMPHTFITNDRRLVLMKPALQAHTQVDMSAGEDITIHQYACKDRPMVLDCTYLNRTVRVQQALYGRRDAPYGVCGLDNTGAEGCDSDVTLILQGACDGLRKCIFNISENFLGDPCIKSDEFLELQYQCSDKGEVLIPFKFDPEPEDNTRERIDRETLKPSLDQSFAPTQTFTHEQRLTTVQIKRLTVLPSTTAVYFKPKVKDGTRNIAQKDVNSTTPTPSFSVQWLSTSTQGNKFVFPVRLPRKTTTSTTAAMTTVHRSRVNTHMRRHSPKPKTTMAKPSRPSPSGFLKDERHRTKLAQNAAIAGCVIGTVVCLLIIILAVLYIKRWRHRRGSKDVSHLVQCHLVENHLQQNPLYSSRPPSGCSGTPLKSPRHGSQSSTNSSSPYQVTDLDKQFTYDCIGDINSSTPAKLQKQCKSSSSTPVKQSARTADVKRNSPGLLQNNSPQDQDLYNIVGNQHRTNTDISKTYFNENPTKQNYYNVRPIKRVDKGAGSTQAMTVGRQPPNSEGAQIYEEISTSEGDNSSQEEIALIHGELKTVNKF